MDTQTTGKCLVWPTHRSFCGPNAWPVVFPRLTQEEANHLISTLETPIARYIAAETWLQTPAVDMMKQRLGRQKTTAEIAADIRSVSDGAPADEVATSPQRSQTILLVARMFTVTDPSQSTTIPQAVLATLWQLVLALDQSRLIVSIPAHYELREARLLHRIACYQALECMALSRPYTWQPDSSRMQGAQSYRRPCLQALRAFAIEAFDEVFAYKLMVELEKSAPQTVAINR
ncbi:hypothetical protein NBRC10512v2_003354 [Rhodotorula toruloides]|uniref:Uncharacterized protein n=1 Tax=Rhodotorula toruloides (strain NP11) TaxID=1130832 RepID=M7WLR4_RHOT1|nr:uncharacterized protein RHTO_05700 [Rhodotorula toruloides NP11]EMS18770.1 hypothetical protein RHTO_05700 [Rhodotorula toruloides NP11]